MILFVVGLGRNLKACKLKDLFVFFLFFRLGARPESSCAFPAPPIPPRPLTQQPATTTTITTTKKPPLPTPDNPAPPERQPLLQPLIISELEHRTPVLQRERYIGQSAPIQIPYIDDDDHPQADPDQPESPLPPPLPPREGTVAVRDTGSFRGWFRRKSKRLDCCCCACTSTSMSPPYAPSKAPKSGAVSHTGTINSRAMLTASIESLSHSVSRN